MRTCKCGGHIRQHPLTQAREAWTCGACGRYEVVNAKAASTAKWPPDLVEAIRAGLEGNTRRDLLQWARRVIARPPSPVELSRAKLVMAIEKGEVA